MEDRTDGCCEIDISICACLNDENTSEGNYIFPNYERYKNTDTFEILSATQLTKVPKSLLTNFQDLRVLRLIDVGIKSLPNRWFEDTNLHLEEIDFRGNKITEILSHSFSGLNCLMILNLAYNHISHIEPKAFEHLPSLNSLFLSNNQLDEIPSNLFDGRDDSPEDCGLSELCLDNNRITNIASEAFNLPHLNILLLRHNKLRALPDDLCRKTPHLDKLDLSDNKLIKIGAIFDECKELFSLDLSDNPNIEDADLFSLTDRLPELSYLFIGNTGFKLPNESPKAFLTEEEYNDRLTHLHLVNNQLSNPDIFLYLQKFRDLKTVKLQHNHFHHINNIDKLNDIFPRLEVIDLHHNPLLNREWVNETKPKSFAEKTIRVKVKILYEKE